MQSDSKNYVVFVSVVKLERTKHVLKLGRSRWFRRMLP